MTIINKFTELNPVKKDNFTKSQFLAVNSIIEFIKSDYDENNSIIKFTGAAGTGKTYSLKAIIQNCNLSPSLIGLASPTHKACRVLREATGLNVSTIQSDLGLKLDLDVENFDINNPPFDPKGRVKINNYKLYIVDEASMLPSGLKRYLESITRKHKIKVIYTGDPYQLAPVKERYSSCFKNVKGFELKEIVRQGEDNPISDLLSILRKDIENRTFNFLHYITKNTHAYNSNMTKGFEVLSKAGFEKMVIAGFHDEEFTKNVELCKVIAYTNNAVNAWNKFIRNSLVRDAQTSIITKNDLLTAYTTIVDDFNAAVIRNSEDYIIRDIIKTRNKSYDILGYMVRFTAIHGGMDTTPLFIVDHTDPNSVYNYYEIFKSLVEKAKKAPSYKRSELWKSFYKFKEENLLLTNIKSADGKKVLVPRSIDYGFALTSHKSQGSTYNYAYVDVNDIVYDSNGQPYTNADDINRRLYVACSRAKDKLYLKFGR